MGSVIIFKQPPFSSTSLLSSISATRCRPLPCRRRCNLRLRTCPTLTTSRICRTNFKSFAANTNVDVDIDIDVDHTNKENEDSQDLLSISSGCSIPIVCLKSDILGTGSLNLLEGNYADSLLTALPVLSEEEQDALEATPAHPDGLYALYASVLAGNLVEQVWNFAWPAAVALIHQSLLPVTVISFFSKLAIFIGGPLVGNLIDCVPRIPAYNCLSLIQATSQLLSAIMIMYGLTGIRHTSASALLLQPWFVVLVGSAAIERLSGLAFGVMVERDWVVLLAGTNREIALAEANAILNRVDMFCEIAGASLFGFLLSKYNSLTCLKLAAGLITCSLPVLLLLGQLTNKLSLGALARPKFCHEYDKSIRNRALNRIENIVENNLDTIRSGFLEYKNQPVLPASIAYVMLSFNIALAPGAMMTTFLTQKGISPSIIGGFSGLCAFMGVAATFLSASLVKKLGVLKAGAAGLIFQSSLLIIATVVLCGGLLSKNPPLLVFLFLVVLSRLGHMIYDVIGTQILQTGIPDRKANLIGATEISIASLAEFFMLGVAIVANDVSHFGFLAMLSVFSIVGATLMYCRWLTNPTAEQRKLFS